MIAKCASCATLVLTNAYRTHHYGAWVHCPVCEHFESLVSIWEPIEPHYHAWEPILYGAKSCQGCGAWRYR